MLSRTEGRRRRPETVGAAKRKEEEEEEEGEGFGGGGDGGNGHRWTEANRCLL